MRLITIPEAAELLRLAPVTVRKMRSQGRLPGALRVGGRALFDFDLLRDFVAAQTDAFAAKTHRPPPTNG